MSQDAWIGILITLAILVGSFIGYSMKEKKG